MSLSPLQPSSPTPVARRSPLLATLLLVMLASCKDPVAAPTTAPTLEGTEYLTRVTPLNENSPPNELSTFEPDISREIPGTQGKRVHAFGIDLPLWPSMRFVLRPKGQEPVTVRMMLETPNDTERGRSIFSEINRLNGHIEWLNASHRILSREIHPKLVEALTPQGGAVPEPIAYDLTDSGSNPAVKDQTIRWRLFVPEEYLQSEAELEITYLGMKDSTNPESPPLVIRLTTGQVIDLGIIGDSIAWGQGNREEHKWYTLVAQQLVEESGRAVRIHRFAHSGATLVVAESNDSSLCGRAWPGEFPVATPTIQCQADALLNRDLVPDVDLLITDGCINDLPSKKDLLIYDEPVIDQKCGASIGRLVERLLSSFPKAQVLYFTYPRFVSENTEYDGVTWWGNVFFDFVESHALWKQRIEQNVENQFSSVQGESGRLKHVSLNGWQPNTAIGGRDSFFHSVRVSNDPNSFIPEDDEEAKELMGSMPSLNDPVLNQRHEMCDRIAHTYSVKENHGNPELNLYMCKIASVYHPNEEGNVAIADALVEGSRGLSALTHKLFIPGLPEQRPPFRCMNPKDKQSERSSGVCYWGFGDEGLECTHRRLEHALNRSVTESEACFAEYSICPSLDTSREGALEGYDLKNRSLCRSADYWPVVDEAPIEVPYAGPEL